VRKVTATKFVAATAVVAVAIQFIPYGKQHINPPVEVSVTWDSPETKALFDASCKDCHSHNTVWPKNTNFAPVSWLIAHDVYDGREHFNVSKAVKAKTINEAIDEVKDGEMPPIQYTLMHQNARLSQHERKALIDGLKKTFLNK